MRLSKSFHNKGLYDRIASKLNGEEVDNSSNPAPSFKDERREAERKAMEHNMKRKAQAEMYPNAAPSEFKEGFKPETTDQDRVIEAASKALNKFLHEIRMGGGVQFEVDDFRATHSHNDVIDHSLITDKALVSFAGKFATAAGKPKIAKFVVSYDYSSDKRCAVENVFYDNNATEYELTSENLENFLKNAEQEVMTDNRETPLAFYNYDADSWEILDTPQPVEKVVAKLKAEGFAIDKQYLDATYGPKDFGKMCYAAFIPSKDLDAFKKIALAVSDDEWFGRSLEKGSYNEGRDQKDNWTERSLETGNYNKEKDKGDNWPNRGLEGGKDGDKKDYGNPYGTEAKMLAADASKKRKEAVKKALAEKDTDTKDILSKLDELDNLIK